MKCGSNRFDDLPSSTESELPARPARVNKEHVDKEHMAIKTSGNCFKPSSLQGNCFKPSSLWRETVETVSNPILSRGRCWRLCLSSGAEATAHPGLLAQPLPLPTPAMEELTMRKIGEIPPFPPSSEADTQPLLSAPSSPQTRPLPRPRAAAPLFPALDMGSNIHFPFRPGQSL